ncbi:hypothetical protein TSMEX_002105, partial [Taenia solium]
ETASLTIDDVTQQEKIEIVDLETVPMLKHKALDLRLFHGRFKPQLGVQHETYLWLTRDLYLAVTVDYTQNGTSPEVEECNRYGGARTEGLRILRRSRKRQEDGRYDKK